MIVFNKLFSPTTDLITKFYASAAQNEAVAGRHSTFER